MGCCFCVLLLLSQRLVVDYGVIIALTLPEHYRLERFLHFWLFTGNLALKNDSNNGRLRCTPLNILVVEDDSVISTFVSDGLKEHGYGVTQCQSAEEAMDEVVIDPFDLAIVDIMLPGMNGLDLVKNLRGQGVTFPILFLSARKTVEDKVSGLRIGGDDYLTKPFSFNELLARVEVLLRRNPSSQTTVTEQLSFHGLSFDPSRKLAWRGDRKLSLQPREMVLLEFFLRNRERVISRTQIMEHVWDYQFDPQTNVVDVLVCRLRSKIDKDEPVKLLHTIRGMGYVLRAGE